MSQGISAGWHGQLVCPWSLYWLTSGLHWLTSSQCHPARRRMSAIAALSLVLWTAARAVAQDTIDIGPAGEQSRVPPWDARGLGPLAWQGIACIDMTADARYVAIGTIAPPGDPNVFLLDGDGKLLGQYKAGQRWIHAVTVASDGSSVSALCTSPKGAAGDVPAVYTFRRDGTADEAQDRLSGGYTAAFFHYGDHSNHPGVFLLGSGKQDVLLAGGRVDWLTGEPGAGRRQAHWEQRAVALTTAAAVAPSGRALVGCAVGRHGGDEAAPNLFLVDPAARGPVWSRAATDTESAAALEKGLYGPPAPPYQDDRVWAPLAVALDRGGAQAASADYQGWERRFAPAGIRRGESYGVRFVPSRPTVQVYDAQGKMLQRFGPDKFHEAFWCDLAFSGDGTKLLASAHRWLCRGLAGQTILPADQAARSLYVLSIATGKVQVIRLPDAVSDLTVAGSTTVVGCFNGRVYLLDERLNPLPSLREGLAVGRPSLVRASHDGTRILVAATDGTLRMLQSKGEQLWSQDLNRLAQPGEKPWTKNQKANAIDRGVWSVNTGRTPSDLGGMYVVQAPDGLILIDPNAGLSLEQSWARMEGSGLDPKQVRYVLLTHEHGDHAPGAYSWRVLTGAQVVASAETAYSLQHHIPLGTGYGFHPPNPVDIVVTKDTELNLAGLKVRAIRLPGHTYGSMGWMFAQGDKTFVAIGDLIMPGGVLGYSGSINFSGEDVLESLQKLARLAPDAVLAGHGPCGDPTPYVTKGIAIGEATGWGKTTPKKPDPLYGFARRNYLVAAWNEPIQSAAFGDVDGDGRPDVAILAAAPKGSQVRIYLNRKGQFAPTADCAVDLPEMDHGFKIRMGRISGGKAADFLVTSEQVAVLLLARDGRVDYRVEPLPAVTRGSQLLVDDFNRDGRTDCLIGGRFVGDYHIASQSEDGHFRLVRSPGKLQTYFDMALVQLVAGRQKDLVTSAGEVFRRRPDGGFDDAPAIQLHRPGDEWTFMGTGDFNADGKTDVVLLSRGGKSTRIAVFYNTGKAEQPLAKEPDATFDLPLDGELLRDGPTVGDFNGDGVDDLIVGAAQRSRATVFLGGSGGISPQRKLVVELDYAIHHDTKLGVADFDGDGKADLVGFGMAPTGSPGIYIDLQGATGARPRLLP